MNVIDSTHAFTAHTPVALTARESQIVALIAQGRSNHEIADELYLSINSVKTYIRSAYRRIGVERRTQAVIWAITHDHQQATDASCFACLPAAG